MQPFENHLNSRTGAGGNFTYTYDGSGTLVKRTTTSTGAWTVYIGGIYEVTNTGAVTKYYTALGKTIAMRQAGTLYWLLSDQLGSNSVVTDGIGMVVGSVKYGPYGGVRSATGSMVTDKLYTGQQQEPGDALGLYNYKARFYSTVLGRFLSVDPVAGNASDPQSWNPFAYTRNNPLRYSDPTGERWEADIEADKERYQQQRFADDVKEQQTGTDWANQGNTTGNGGSCVACDTLRALAAAGIVSPEIARAADEAACGESCQGLRALAEAGQGVDFYKDAMGGESASEAGYQPEDLVADVSGLADASTLFSADPDTNINDRVLAGALLAIPGPNPSGGAIKGFSRHGLDQMISRDGVGVSERAMLDAVKYPDAVVREVDDAGRVTYRYVGKNAEIILNDSGKVVTGWARNASGFRIPRPW